jgi:hypothetical protein
MNEKQSSDFVLGIAGNLVASLIIALANILIGRFAPNFSHEVLDVASLVLPLVLIFMFLYRGKIKQIRIEPRLWILRIRESITKTPQAGQIKQLFYGVVGCIRQFITQLSEIKLQSKNWINYLEKAIKPSVIIVTVITVFLIIGFGVSIRMLYEQRTITTAPSVYSSYQQIYDFLAP